MPPKADFKIAKTQTVETQEIHCPKCGRFLGYQAIMWGHLSIKCPHCKEWTRISIEP